MQKIQPVPDDEYTDQAADGGDGGRSNPGQAELSLRCKEVQRHPRLHRHPLHDMQHTKAVRDYQTHFLKEFA